MVEAIRSYHARRGRLSDNQRWALNTLAPQWDLALFPDPLDLDVVYGRSAPKILEIGSGLGDTAPQLAQENPDRDYIAADVHSKGIARTLLLIAQRDLANLRVLHGDALDLITRRLPAACLSEVLVFFLTRGRKPGTTSAGSCVSSSSRPSCVVLQPGGTVHLATDDPAYAHVMREVLGRQSRSAEDPRRTPRPAQTRTKYERAGERHGRLAIDLMYRLQAPSES